MVFIAIICITIADLFGIMESPWSEFMDFPYFIVLIAVGLWLITVILRLIGIIGANTCVFLIEKLEKMLEEREAEDREKTNG